jgi:CRP/FNR family transcriptional regulator, cyclic AMP receptor protein
MAKKRQTGFDPEFYLSTTGPGRSIIRVKAKQVFSSQGEHADCLFYLRTGRAKLTIVSKAGKEATVTLLAPGDFFGEECMAGSTERRTTSAVAISICVVLKIASAELTRVMSEQNTFTDKFVRFIVRRGTRTQADLIDQLFNNSERRLARTLLLMAEYGNAAGPLKQIPSVTQEALAEMIGTTRSRVSFFMNRFRRLGYITYNGRIHVHKKLLSMVLLDILPEQNASRPKLLDPPPSRGRTARRANFLAASKSS